MKFFSKNEEVAAPVEISREEKLAAITADIHETDARMEMIARKIRAQGNVITPEDSDAMSAERIKWNQLLAARAELISAI